MPMWVFIFAKYSEMFPLEDAPSLFQQLEDLNEGPYIPESSILKESQFRMIQNDLLFFGPLLLYCAVALMVLRLLVILVITGAPGKPLPSLCKGFPWIQDSIVDVMLYASSDLIFIYAIQHPRQEIQTRISIFAAVVALLTYLNQSIRRREIFSNSIRNSSLASRSGRFLHRWHYLQKVYFFITLL